MACELRLSRPRLLPRGMQVKAVTRRRVQTLSDAFRTDAIGRPGRSADSRLVAESGPLPYCTKTVRGLAAEIGPRHWIASAVRAPLLRANTTNPNRPRLQSAAVAWSLVLPRIARRDAGTRARIALCPPDALFQRSQRDSHGIDSHRPLYSPSDSSVRKSRIWSRPVAVVRQCDSIRQLYRRCTWQED